ncbi:MAG: parallel beta-helix domain-containing protein [Chitinophagales bacterium]|nr:parallel beta-helix domain-containing protein [Chitinophagales bacterium]
MRKYFLLVLPIWFASCGGGHTAPTVNWIKPGPDDQKTVQSALMSVKPGDTLYFDEGVFHFTAGLSLSDIDSVTLKGKGMDKTIFSFKEQTTGAEGLKVVANHFAIEDMAIEDPKGDGIKVQNADGVVFRRLRVEWTGKADSSNGAYGLYPVSSRNILMEECVAIGASDAGVYVGQSENAIVRRNRVERNVAGIEIENTINADCYENTVTNNTAGILIFDLPGLPKKNGRNMRIYNNQVLNNNHPNFSSMGISVSMVPSGVGLLFMACQDVEAFGNRVIDNYSIGTAIFNLDQMGRVSKDSLYDKYPAGIYLHDNIYERKMSVPDTTRAFGKMVYQMFGNEPPIVFFDGFQNPALLVNGKIPDSKRICLRNNTGATFYNMATKSTDVSQHDCSLSPLAETKVAL